MRIALNIMAAFGIGVTAACPPAIAQDVLNDNIGFSGAALHIKHYVTIPGQEALISLTSQPQSTGNTNLFVTAQSGMVYSVADNGTGGGVAAEWFNYNAAINAAIPNAENGFVLEDPTGTHGGLRSIAFHPDFATNGKFYTSALVDRPEGVSGLNYLGISTAGFDGESVLAEWTYDAQAGQVDSGSYRELFRVQVPIYDHTIKQITFNHYAQPGDEDYGLLYIAHGDGSTQTAVTGGGLNGDEALGKILRINPLQNGAEPYTTPGNPFLADLSTLDEVYTLGHRNPHHISFARDSQGGTHLIAAEAGRDNIEEVNVLTPGGNYGWSEREGTFIYNNTGGPHGRGYGIDYGISYLPENEWELNDYIYPAAQYDHNAALGSGWVGSAIAGGFVIDNHSDPALQGQYIFADFGSKNGWVYQAGLNDLLGAHTQLADGETPDMLTQATLYRLMLTLDSNGDGIIDNTADNLNTLFGEPRTDARFGRGPNGEMFISSKQTGAVYLVTNTLPALPGDLNYDGFVGILDLNIVLDNWNQSVTPLDWMLGDPSGDGFVGIDDLNQVLGNWNTGIPLPAPASTNIPEPAACVVLLLGAGAYLGRRRVNC